MENAKNAVLDHMHRLDNLTIKQQEIEETLKNPNRLLNVHTNTSTEPLIKISQKNVEDILKEELDQIVDDIQLVRELIYHGVDKYIEACDKTK